MLQCCFFLLGLLCSTAPTWAGDPEAGQTTDVYEALRNIEQQCSNRVLRYKSGLSLLVGNSTGEMAHARSKYIDSRDTLESLYSGLHQPSARFLLDISCLLDSQNELNCSWNNTDIPAKAEYAITGRLCRKTSVLSSWNCTLYNQGKRTGCEGNVGHLQNHYATVIQVNVSVSGLWYIHSKYFFTNYIEKMDPPKNISCSFTEGNQNLTIQWEKAISRRKDLNKYCLMYGIKIDDEDTEVTGRLNYHKQDIDRHRRYTVQMRVKLHNDCRTQEVFWSDWSEAIEVGPAEEPQPEYRELVILAIVLGLPMILLVFLLLSCKIRRVLFPPIPRPSIQIKQLLEKDFAFQVKMLCRGQTSLSK
ncbi:hypothetical protein ACEWY4_012823 [Coilia grayii]|uniref:Uncharacterized protein n=1 Tax=Coilia grayii TaxID=363190 RepID=A0ABD1JUQ5_9TELE